jgi:hypothetical protein
MIIFTARNQDRYGQQSIPNAIGFDHAGSLVSQEKRLSSALTYDSYSKKQPGRFLPGYG